MFLFVLLSSICVCVDILKSARAILQHNNSAIAARCHFMLVTSDLRKANFNSKWNWVFLMAKAGGFIPELLSGLDLETYQF